MVEASSNIDEVARGLEAVIASIGFTMPGQNQNLGRDVTGAVAQGIHDRSIPDARAPAGSPWRPNTVGYAAYKRVRYVAFQPGIRTGQMLSLASLQGQPRIAPEAIEMAYGLGVRPYSTTSGVPLAESDKKVTDREKADRFTADGREFYALDDHVIDQGIMPLVVAAVNKAIG